MARHIGIGLRRSANKRDRLQTHRARKRCRRIDGRRVQFCDDLTCPGVKSGVLVYKDANHLTEDFAKLQVPAFRALLAEHKF